MLFFKRDRPTKPAAPSTRSVSAAVAKPSTSRSQTATLNPPAAKTSDVLIGTSFVANDGTEESLAAFDFDGPGRRLADWKKSRKAPSKLDRQASDEAMAWFVALPKNLRMFQTLASYPHVVNNLHAVWDDPEALTILFENLINSRRQKRVGFPPDVKSELVVLRAWAFAQKRLA